jgi:hypothetical protein
VAEFKDYVKTAERYACMEISEPDTSEIAEETESKRFVTAN